MSETVDMSACAWPGMRALMGHPGGPHRGRRQGGRWGAPPPWAAFGGPPFGGPGGPPWMRQRRAGRGDVRSAVLLLLDDGARNGYQLIQDIAERTGGRWRPSPGSIYPSLAQLHDEGLVAESEGEGGRTFELTEAGRADVAARREELAAVFDTGADSADEPAAQLHDLLGQVAAAAAQVLHAGTRTQVTKARALLVDTRRALYRLLAEDADEEQT